MTKKIYLEALKSVLDRSILHFWQETMEEQKNSGPFRPSYSWLLHSESQNISLVLQILMNFYFTPKFCGFLLNRYGFRKIALSLVNLTPRGHLAH